MKKTLPIIVFLAIFLFSPALSGAFFDSSLKYGSRGDAVIELQDFLQDQGFLTGNIDGRFGFGTRKAVIAFQAANSLKADGYFGLASRAKANTLLPAIDDNETEISETGGVTPLATVEGCVSTVGYSTLTGRKCDGTIITSQVTDPETQARLDALTSQLQAQQDALSQIAQNTTRPIPTPVVHDLPKILGYRWIYNQNHGRLAENGGDDVRYSSNQLSTYLDSSCSTDYIFFKTDVVTVGTLKLLEIPSFNDSFVNGDGYTAYINRSENQSNLKEFNLPTSTQYHRFCLKDLGMEAGKKYAFTFSVTDSFSQTVQLYDGKFGSTMYVDL